MLTVHVFFSTSESLPRSPEVVSSEADASLTQVEHDMDSEISSAPNECDPKFLQYDGIISKSESSNVLDEFNDWCDDGDDGPDNSLIMFASGFEARAFDQGYRETLRNDYPEAEKLGRITGFLQAFKASIIIGNVNSPNPIGGLDDQIRTLVRSMEKTEIKDRITEDSAVPHSYHPTLALAKLDGSLSLLLLNHQIEMSDDQLKEVISVRAAVKHELQNISLSYATYQCDFPVEQSALPLESISSEQSNSPSIVPDNPEAAKIILNKVLDHSVIPPTNPILFDDSTNDVVNSLYNRAQTLALAFNWSVPSLL